MDLKKKGSLTKRPKDPKDYSANWKEFMKNAKKDIGVALKYVSQKNASANENRRKRGKFHESLGKKRQKHIGVIKSNKKTKQIDEKNILGISDIWFDDVDPEIIAKETRNAVMMKSFLSENKTTATKTDEKTKESISSPLITKRLALDCEMVGVGIDGKESILARVSLVNSFGQVVYDQFVSPSEKVIDYRTAVSGIRPQDLKDAPNFTTVQKEVSDLLKGKILVGHALHHDLKVLMLSHPRKMVRDTSTYKPFKKLVKSHYPSLKRLSKAILHVDIQTGEHSSVEDSRVAMKIYQLHKREWEKSLKDHKVKATSKGAQESLSTNRNDIIHKKRKYRRREKKNR